MSKAYYAVTRIKHGKVHKNEDPTKSDRHETVWFEEGDKVTGLDVEEMKRLWNAGALREETAEDREKESGRNSEGPETDKSPGTDKSGAAGSAPKSTGAPTGRK